MGNDPVNLIDPSGGVGIPCPGTSQLALFFMKAGEVISNGLNTIGQLSSVVSITNQVTRTAAYIYNQSVEHRIISQQLVNNATGQVGRENGNQQSDYWILYNGTEVNIYDGEYGNTENLVRSFKGTSGIYTTSTPEGTEILKDYRNAKYQFTKDWVIEGGKGQLMFVGPIPEGNYSINLYLDPERQARLASNGETLPGKGMEKITYFKNEIEYVRYSSWGSRRARLEADASTTQQLRGRDGNFYFHNSHKGYTHQG